MADVHQLTGASVPPTAAEPLKACRSSYEAGFLANTNAPAALVFNPNAAPSALAAAGLSRATILRRALNNWACVPDAGDASPADIAQYLEPLADELRLLLSELLDRLVLAEREEAAQ